MPAAYRSARSSKEARRSCARTAAGAARSCRLQTRGRSDELLPDPSPGPDSAAFPARKCGQPRPVPEIPAATELRNRYPLFYGVVRFVMHFQQVHAPVVPIIAPNGVDVVRMILRFIHLNQERRRLDPIVVRSAALRLAGPGEER